MASTNVRQFTDSNFKAEVLDSDRPVLVDFWAQWCPPCRALGPIVDSVADELAGSVKVGKVNTDENPGLAAHFGITSIPTIMVFRGGKLVARMVGLRPKADLIAALSQAAAA